MNVETWIARAVKVLRDARRLLADPELGDKYDTRSDIDALLRDAPEVGRRHGDS